MKAAKKYPPATPVARTCMPLQTCNSQCSTTHARAGGLHLGLSLDSQEKKKHGLSIAGWVAAPPRLKGAVAPQLTVLLVYEDNIPIVESFYDSPPNFSLTKSPVSKPAPDRIPSITASLDTPTSSIDRPLRPRKYMDTLTSKVSFLVSSSHEASVKENRWF